jgi:predicted RNase H-like nuclease (RuvC/YqgF family)
VDDPRLLHLEDKNFSKERTMNQDVMQQLATTADRLAGAAETLDRVLARIDSQQEAMNAKVDRIVAAVEDWQPEREVRAAAERPQGWDARIAELEKANTELKAQAARLARKTLSPLVSALLSKSVPEAGERMEAGALDKALHSLSVEQRIAVKAEMARAGMIE